jgi:hypothetical protein
MKATAKKPAKSVAVAVAAARPTRPPSALRGTVVVDNLTMTREMFDHFKKHRDEGREVLARAGIYTRGGKLTKAYGG